MREIVVSGAPELRPRLLLYAVAFIFIAIISLGGFDDANLIVSYCSKWALGSTYALSVLSFQRVLLATLLVGYFGFATFCRTGRGDGEMVIKVYPLGIQRVKRYKNNKKSGYLEQKPLFIPRNHILDCIVLEHVLATKVTSVVLFRIRTRSKEDSNTSNCTALVEAFPGAKEMSYVSCVALRAEILKALDETAT